MADIKAELAKINATVSQVNNTVSNYDNKINTAESKVDNFLNNPVLKSAINVNSNKPLYYDKYTFPYGCGPYQVDAIPMLVKDKFKMPKFTRNSPTDQYVYSPEEYDTQAYPEMIVFVPSKRKTVQTTQLFNQQNVGECDNLGSFQMSLEDYCLASGRNGNIGLSLNAKVQAFKTSVQDANTTVEDRTAKLNAILSDPDYKFIKDNVKLPFKIWNQIPDGSGNFVFDNLLDENNNLLQNQLVNGSSFTTKVTRSTWPLDSSGNPTELLPVEQNINASGPIDATTGETTTPLNPNNKMGLFIFNKGISDAHNSTSTNVIGNIASWGYVVIVYLSSPLNGSWSNFNSKTTISRLLANKTISKFDNNDTTGNYFINLFQSYTNENGTTVANPSRGNISRASLSIPGRLIYERHLYQGLCILRKLGLYNKINFDNVVYGGLSNGGRAMNNIHDLQPTGIASQFTLINGIKPLLVKIKALISWQCVFTDLSLLTTNQRVASRDFNINNKYCVGIGVLKVPLIHITGDGDIYDRPPTGNTYDNLFNGSAQVIFQQTKQVNDDNTDFILSKSMVIYKPVNAHSPNVLQLDVGDGEITAIYCNSLFSNWLTGGYPIAQYPQVPSINNIIESGIQSELNYVFYEDLKTMIALQLSVHRFLGIDYPVPTQAFGSLGWRIDIMPTHCDVLTDYQFLRVGPTSYISYDNKYNLTIDSKEIVTNSNGLVLKSEDGTKTYKLVIDSSGNVKTLLVV